jgi:hypothetical protein
VSWFRRKAPPPAFPPPKPRALYAPKPKDEGITVEEIDTSDMTKTGVHRAWDRLTGRFKGEK